MLSQDQIQSIQAPFPPEALSADTSRGFELTSIKAAFVIERLNQVFGPCGIGWRYVHAPFEEIQTHDGRIEIITEVAFQYRYRANNDVVGCDKVVWDAQAHDWAYRAANHDWSEPIFAAGGKTVTKGGAPFTDARKSAVTDGLTKAASMLGIGHEVFKGLVRVGSDNGSVRTADNDPVQPAGNGRQRAPDSTMFWTLYNAQGKAAGVPIDAAKGLANRGDWTAALADLQALIAGAKT